MPRECRGKRLERVEKEKAHGFPTSDLFHPTHRVKTQFVVKNRGKHCGDLELAANLANAAGPVPLVLDLRITHDRIGSSVTLP